VLLLHSLAGLALTYALGLRLGLHRCWSLAGATLLAASPLYLFMSLWAMSDVPAMTWVTAAMIAAWKGREWSAWAFVAGVCAAVAFLVRPSNFLISVPMLFVIGPSPRRLLLVLAGGLPGVAAWMAINHAFLGTRTRVAAVLAAWAAVYIAFYAPYRWTHQDWWFLRFLLPAAPALLVAGLIVLQWVFESLQGRLSELTRRALLGVLFLTAVWVEVRQIKPLHAWSIGHGEEKYGRVADWLKTHIPKNSVIIAEQFSGATYFFTNFVLIRSDELDNGTAEQVREAVRSEGRPVYIVAFPAEQNLTKELPGNWVHLMSIEDVLIWRGDWGDSGK
jgi:hypothetical protein